MVFAESGDIGNFKPIVVCPDPNFIFPMYHGYIASKKRYFYGLKIHLVVTQDGQPVEFFLTPGADSDLGCLDLFDFDLPEGSEVYADRIYNDYVLEDIYQEAGFLFRPLRKKNSKRPHPPWLIYWIHRHRKMIEMVGSLLEQLMPKHIHAVTAVGFELKVALLLLAHSFNCVFKVATLFIPKAAEFFLELSWPRVP